MFDFWKAIFISMLLFSSGLGCAPSDGDSDGDDGGGVGGDGDGDGDGDSDGDGDGDADGELAVDLSGIEAYEALAGEVDFEVGVTGEPELVELLAGDEVVASATAAPYDLVWSTGVGDDGIVALTARARVGDDVVVSSEVPVVVVNGGDLAALFEGEEGALSIAEDFEPNPLDPGVGLDVVHHWLIDIVSTRAIAVVTWDEDEANGWEIELAVGTGSCPHGGTTFGTVAMAGGGGGIDIEPDASFAAGEQHFSHIRVLNPEDHLGDTLEFEMRVYLFE